MARVRGKTDRPGGRPAPDLAIEVVYTHPAPGAGHLPRLGVPEVWVCDEDGVRILVLQADGRYARVPTSRAFPFLTAAEYHRLGRRLVHRRRVRMDHGTPPLGAPRRWPHGSAPANDGHEGSPPRIREVNRMAIFRVPYPSEPERAPALFEKAVAKLGSYGRARGRPTRAPSGARRRSAARRVVPERGGADEVEIEIAKKPLLVPLAMIESEARKFVATPEPGRTHPIEGYRR